jgi:hypothetical protein
MHTPKGNNRMGASSIIVGGAARPSVVFYIHAALLMSAEPRAQVGAIAGLLGAIIMIGLKGVAAWELVAMI